ncbi:MAG: response regulator [Balneolaceae bacterium]
MSLVVYLFIKTRRSDDGFELTTFEQNMYLQSIASKTDHAVAIVDTDDRIKFANEHFLDLFSVRTSDIEGKILDETPLPMSVQKRMTMNRNGDIKFMKDGIEETRLMNIHSITDDHGKLLGRLLTIEQKFKKADIIIPDKFNKLDELSHNINTPLNVISGYSEILADDDNLTEEQREKISVITNKSRELRSVINDLLQEEGERPPVNGEKSNRKSDIRKVMIVDDVSFNRTLLKIMLERNKFSYCEATNGKEAIEIMQKCNPDLICMDISMPVMDGVETFDYIRSLENQYAEIPIIAVTANSRKNNRERLLKKGFDGFLQKPFREKELLDLIHQLKH